jgi:hypothetical protein
MDAANCETISGSVNPVTFEAQRQARPQAPVRGSTLGRIVLLYLPDSNSFRQVDPLRVERDRGFADSLLEEAGFEPSVPAVKTRFSEERPGAEKPGSKS